MAGDNWAPLMSTAARQFACTTLRRFLCCFYPLGWFSSFKGRPEFFHASRWTLLFTAKSLWYSTSGESYTHIYVCIYICVCIYIYIYIFISLKSLWSGTNANLGRAHTHKHTHTRTNTQLCTHNHTHMHAWLKKPEASFIQLNQKIGFVSTVPSLWNKIFAVEKRRGKVLSKSLNHMAFQVYSLARGPTSRLHMRHKRSGRRICW